MSEPDEPKWMTDAVTSVALSAQAAGIWTQRDLVSAILSRAVNVIDDLRFADPNDGDPSDVRLDAAKTIREDCFRLLAAMDEHEAGGGAR